MSTGNELSKMLKWSNLTRLYLLWLALREEEEVVYKRFNIVKTYKSPNTESLRSCGTTLLDVQGHM